MILSKENILGLVENPPAEMVAQADKTWNPLNASIWCTEGRPIKIQCLACDQKHSTLTAARDSFVFTVTLQLYIFAHNLDTAMLYFGVCDECGTVYWNGE